MSEQTHTPGPWKYHLGRGASPRFHIQASGGYQIASTTEHVQHEENAILEARKANARLIAAAPELLEALEDLIADLEDADEDNGQACENARAVIKKAKGKS